MMSTSSLLLASYRDWFSNSFTPRGPRWWQVIWTFVFCVQVALVLTGFAWVYTDGRGGSVDYFLNNLQVSLCVGFSIHLLFSISRRVMAYISVDPLKFKDSTKAIYFTAIPIVGVCMGVVVFLMLKGYNPVDAASKDPRFVISALGISIFISLFLFVVWLQREQKLRLQAAAERSDAQAQTLKRQNIEAELRTLQAQIEPHFLFNTLANVLSLIDYDAPQAKRMLESFIEYLRASLDSNRRTQATVGDELQVVERYLQLLQIRMGERLRYAITADEAVKALPLAPLMLQPLVENAVKYGIEPNVEGGGVSIAARLQDERLVLTVLDSGLGLAAGSTARKGNGMALKNIRERLAAQYGDQASFSLESVDTAGKPGTLATISLPQHSTPT
jgi:sensor histidine kinase YesM